ETGERGPDLGLERFLRGLRRIRKVAEHAPAVRRERLEVEDLRTGAGEPLEEAALARARRAADHVEADALGERLEVGHHLAAERLVAPVEAHGIPSDLAQHVRERPGAAAAAPAIDERPPVPGLVAEALLDRAGDVARGDGRSQALRLEGR